MVSTEQPIVLDDELWERMVQITDGAASACYQCGACTAVCPWGDVRGEPLNVRQLMRRAQLGLDDDGTDIWLCTGCRECLALCPRGVDVPGLFRSLRGETWRQQQVPEGLSSVLWSVHWDGNPWSQPPSQRFAWADDLGLESFTPEHELLLYIGCSASYDSRLQKVARALVSVLQAAEIPFGVLGEQEPCCGEAVLALGNEQYLSEIVEHNQRLFAEAGASTVVTISPHCFDMFTSHYTVGDEFHPLHYTQLLAELIESERLPLSEVEPLAITYQDPCFLGRAHGVYDAPREALSAIAGVDLREMENNREQGLCCGGGGGRMWMETPVDERFAVVRARDAQATGAEVLATACPACLSCLEDGLKVIGAGEMRVMDVAEVVQMALEPASEPAVVQEATP